MSGRHCGKDCPNRTVTCKFDGSCDGWELDQAEARRTHEREWQLRKRFSLADGYIRVNYLRRKIRFQKSRK